MPETPRLLTDATSAFVDHASIDWIALSSRARGSPDRALVEALHLLDTVRDTAPRALSAPHAPPVQPALLVRLVAALAAIQTTGCLLVVSLALAYGATLTERASNVVLAVAFGAASLLLIATSRDGRSLFLLAAFASAASGFARLALLDLPASWSAPIDPLIRGIVPEAFTPACVWRFALDFPRVQRFTSFDVMARRATAAAWILGAVSFGVNLADAYVSLGEGALSYLLRGHPAHLFWHAFTLALLAPVCAIFVRSRRAPPSERRRVARLAAVFAAGITPFLLSSVVRMLSPAFDTWLWTSSSPERVWHDRLVVGALAAMPILTTMAVMTDRPFELHAIRGHGSWHAAARTVVTVIAFAPFALLAVSLYGQRQVPIGDAFSGSRALPLVAWTVLGCALVMARSRLLRVLDRRVFWRAVDQHEQLALALERVRVARGVREIVGVLGRELGRGLGAETGHVLVSQHADGFADPFRASAPLPDDSALLAMLRATMRPLDLSSEGQLLALLPRHDREWVVSQGVEIAAPLTRRDGELAAIVMLGGKRGGSRFDRRDRWLVTAMTMAAATAWDADASSLDVADSARLRSAHAEAAFECPRCGDVAESSPVPCDCGADAVLASLPHRLGSQFLVWRRLGAGGMGVVYRGRDTSLDRDVALKTLPALGSGAVARLRDEARAMAALNHESLATIYGLELWQHTPVLVVEYFPDGTLARRLASGAMSAVQAVRLGARLAAALAYMHDKGVLHRDLKPSNIALTATGAPKLLDFGLVTWISAGGVQAAGDTMAGTPAYLPPEAHRGAPPSAAFDLWALAVVVLEALTGVNPFMGSDRLSTRRRVLHADLEETFSGLRNAQPATAAFLERALDRRPDVRLQSARDVQTALEALGAIWKQ